MLKLLSVLKLLFKLLSVLKVLLKLLSILLLERWYVSGNTYSTIGHHVV